MFFALGHDGGFPAAEIGGFHVSGVAAEAEFAGLVGADEEWLAEVRQRLLAPKGAAGDGLHTTPFTYNSKVIQYNRFDERI